MYQAMARPSPSKRKSANVSAPSGLSAERSQKATFTTSETWPYLRVEALRNGVVAAIFAVAAVMTVGAARRPPVQSPPASIAITGVTVVDVEKGVAVADQNVLIAAERILKVGPRRKVKAPKGWMQIDGRGLYLMPGLVDAHVHYYDPQVYGRALVANGIVLVRDMGQPNESALSLRQALNGGTMLGPEMVTTGWMLDGDPALVPQASRVVRTPDEGRAAVRQQANAGVDQIKVYSGLQKDVFLAIVDEARRAGLKTVGHVPESVYVEDAIAAGQRSIEHLFGFEKLVGRLLGEEITLRAGGIGADFDYWLRLGEINRDRLQQALQHVAASGVVVCPTLVLFKAQSRLEDISARAYPMSEYISPAVQDVWKAHWNPSDRELMEKVWPILAGFVRELHKAGVPLMTGTDLTMPGVIPGFSLHEEMTMWQEAGIPAADVLRGATIVPARFLGKDQRLGTIAEGKAASLVLLKGNPLMDVGSVRQIQGVFLRGRYYSHADLDQLLEQARNLAR